MNNEGYNLWKANDPVPRSFDDMAAFESAMVGADVRVVQDGVPMKINLMTQEIMDMNIKLLHIKEVDNPICFERGTIPTVGGLFSEVVFGTTSEERKKTWGYINLNTKVIHPYVYEILIRIQQNIEQICRGEGSWKVNSKGLIVPVKESDADYDPDNTGIDWFIENYPKMKFPRNQSSERDERLDFLATFTPEEIFIDKWMVIPVFYRDVETRDGPPQIPQLDKEYQNLIRYSRSVQQETISFVNVMAKYNIQKTLVNIRKYFQSLIEKSDGFFHQYVMGKNPDYGARSVISCAVLDQYDKPSEDPIDMTHTGIPLAQVCIMLFPFIRRWVHNYIENYIATATHANPVGNAQDEHVEYGDVMAMYTPDFIKKKIDNWIDNYESRFDPVEFPLKDGTMTKVAFRGMPYANDPDNVKASTISKRYFTWTDLLYIAAVDVAENKVVWITRYPIVGYMNSINTMIHVMSTSKTMPVLLDGRIYKYYPVIDVTLPKRVVATSFNDTVNMSNVYLAAMNGDYDGDTVSMRCPFLEESNEECINIINSKKQYVDTQGSFVRMAKNESFLMLYNITREDPKAPKVDDATKHKFLSMDPEEIGIKELTYMFGTTADLKTKKINPPRYDVTAKVHLNAGEYINKEAVDTTLGRIVLNKILVEPYISKIIPNGYINQTLTGKATKSLFKNIGDSVMYDKLTPEEAWPFLKAFEFYTTKGVTIFSPSYTSNILIPKKEILDDKEKFFKEHPNPTLDEIDAFENKATAKATKMIENDPGMPLFAADARGSVADNYKVMSIMVGSVLNPMTGETEMIKSDYVTGLSKDELPQAGNVAINGIYPKACGTAESGYVTKQFNSVFQGIVVDDDGTDCGTSSYLKVVIKESHWKPYEFQNIIDNGKLVPLTSENYKKYVNRPIKMRSPMCCKADVICSACAGRRPYIQGMKTIGLQMNNMPNMFLEKSMKKFHVAKIELTSVDPDKLLI